MSQQAQALVQAQQKTAEASSIKGSILQRAAVIPAITPVHSAILQRCSGGVECEACRQRRLEREGVLQRAAVSASPVNKNGNGVPPIVHEVLNSPGQSLDAGTRAFMEPRFGHDFSQVRVHTDAKAAESARAVNALAYTVGRDVVFGIGQYAPGTSEGRRLMAHELTHVVQQGDILTALNTKLMVSAPDDVSEQIADATADLVMGRNRVGIIRNELGLGSTWLQRACLPASVCSAPIAGSAGAFGARVETAEEAARRRRSSMTPARARAHSHGGKAHQLELFLDSQSPGLRTNIHGIFIDQDMSSDVEASTEACDEFVPPILGATKPCVFVHDTLNQQAFAFNTTAAPSIGGVSREDWRVQTLQTLTHEIQHVIFDTAFSAGTVASPTGVACSRGDVEGELSELNAMMSEFPIAFRAIPVGAGSADPARTRLNDWFSNNIVNPGESISGTLTKIRCKCSCADTDKFVIDTFNFVSASWSPAEKAVFNTELKKPVWHLDWPL